ncbi:MAG: low affinity iron permease family protein [Bauldia sp.]
MSANGSSKTMPGQRDPKRASPTSLGAKASRLKRTVSASMPLPEPSASLLRAALLESYFSPFSARVSNWAGGHTAFLLALILVVVWAAFGPITGYSDNWMLVINTSTTIVTFLMVFIIQSSQNRDTRALQVKIDELLRATQGASNSLIDLEQLTRPRSPGCTTNIWRWPPRRTNSGWSSTSARRRWKRRPTRAWRGARCRAGRPRDRTGAASAWRGWREADPC